MGKTHKTASKRRKRSASTTRPAREPLRKRTYITPEVDQGDDVATHQPGTPWPDHVLLFAHAGGKLPVPLLPYDASGMKREPDGKVVFSIHEAMERFSAARADLERLWQMCWDQHTQPNCWRPGAEPDGLTDDPPEDAGSEEEESSGTAEERSRMCFLIRGGFPLPVLLATGSGVVVGDLIEADGKNILNLKQAAARFAVDAESLVELHDTAMKQIAAQTADENGREAAKLAWLRSQRYPELTLPEFQRLIAFCRSHELDPARRTVRPVRTDGKLAFRLTPQAIRQVAYDTAARLVVDPPRFHYEGSKLVRATVTVMRGEPAGAFTFTGHAEFTACAKSPARKRQLDADPEGALAEIAELRALRRAFPDVFPLAEMPRA